MNCLKRIGAWEIWKDSSSGRYLASDTVSNYSFRHFDECVEWVRDQVESEWLDAHCQYHD